MKNENTWPYLIDYNSNQWRIHNFFMKDIRKHI